MWAAYSLTPTLLTESCKVPPLHLASMEGLDQGHRVPLVQSTLCSLGMVQAHGQPKHIRGNTLQDLPEVNCVHLRPGVSESGGSTKPPYPQKPRWERVVRSLWRGSLPPPKVEHMGASEKEQVSTGNRHCSNLNDSSSNGLVHTCQQWPQSR